MIGSELYSSLPPEMKNMHHYFCCKENGLSSIELKELINMKKAFLKNKKYIHLI